MKQSKNINKNKQNVFLLPEEFSIGQLGEYSRMLINRAQDAGDIELDGNAVTRVDATGIQLLFVLQRALSEAGNSLRWSGASDVLRRSVSLLGMSECLGLGGDD
jgi:ABC-type transporter Mla MlaB component